MKKIAVVSNGYAWFPIEPGPSRFFYLARLLADEGWDVEVITTSFQHFSKKPRDQKQIIDQHYPFKITFIKTPSYKKNIDLRRVYSNHITARNTVNYLKKSIQQYDAVYCSIPSNNVAAKVSEVCKANKIPFIVDIEDLWPEAMSMIIKNNAIRNLLLHGMNSDAEIAYANASGVVGTSVDYTERAFRKRERNIPYETIYVGCDLAQFDEGVTRFKNEIKKPKDEFWVTYAGSIGTSYDIRTLINAGKELQKIDQSIKIQILGTGPLKENLEYYSKEIQANNVVFWGYVPYPKMAAVLYESDTLINSFVKGAPQSIVNKIGDYLAAGKPIINTLENPVFCDLVEKNNVGINIQPGLTDMLVKTVIELFSSRSASSVMGSNGRRLCEQEFNRKISYMRIIDLINRVGNT